MIALTDYEIIFPELTIVILAIMCLIAGLISKRPVFVSRIALFGLLVPFYYLLEFHEQPVEYIFHKALLSDNMIVILKEIMILATIGIFLLFPSNHTRSHEVPSLILFNLLSIMILLSANDFLVLYIGLELLNFTSYILASIERDDIKSTEAGLKYFILGALMSGVMLFGISLLYGFSGSINFTDLAALYGNPSAIAVPIGAIIGGILVIIALLFKVSAVPFHVWTPDVYEGSPLIVTSLFAILPKIALTSLLIRLLVGPFINWSGSWENILLATSLLSLIVGSLGALKQQNIKRLMAYSTINHIGFILLGILCFSNDAIMAVFNYLVIYLTMTLGLFAILVEYKRSYPDFDYSIKALSSMYRNKPYMAIFASIFLLSMAGIPPFAGFFAKLGILLVLIKKGNIALAVIAVIMTVISSFYYLNIIRYIYFTAPILKSTSSNSAVGTTIVASSMACVNIVYIFIYYYVMHLFQGWDIYTYLFWNS